jgi:hypothetical protein
MFEFCLQISQLTARILENFPYGNFQILKYLIKNLGLKEKA